MGNLFIIFSLAIFNPQDVGTTALPLLKLDLGPRASALGETFTGLADDVTALYWNPAGLAQISNWEFFLSHQEWFLNTRDEYLSFALPLNRFSEKSNGTLGLGIVYSSNENVEFWSSENLPGDTFGTNSGYLTLGYGLKINDDFFIGGGIKGAYENLRTEKGTGVATDLGLLYKLANFNLGMAIKNLGFGLRYGQEYERLPLLLKLGSCYYYKMLNLLLDLNLPIDNSPNLHFGSEWTIGGSFAIRTGFRTGPQDLSGLDWKSGFTFGFGIILTNFAIDYALVSYGKLGTTHRIGLRTTIAPKYYGTLKIRVIDHQNQRPLIAQLKITSPLKTIETETNERGESFVTGLKPGWIKVISQKDKYYPATDSVYITDEKEHSITFGLKSLGYGTVWGGVYDVETKKPLGGKIFYEGIVQGSQKIDSLVGTYTLRNLPNGSYKLKVIGPKGYASQEITIEVESDMVKVQDFYLEPKK